MNRKLIGGHAIMLEVEISPFVRDIAVNWTTQRGDAELKINPETRFGHLTLAFIGRDLTAKDAVTVYDVAEEFLLLVPPEVHFTGDFEMFGRQRDHLVALVEKDSALTTLNQTLIGKLRERGLRVSGGTRFNPHVTLGTSDSKKYPPPSATARSFRVVGAMVKQGSDYLYFEEPPR